MKCPDTERIWNELLDGDREALPAELSEHALICPVCAEASQRYSLLRDVIGRARPAAASEEFLTRLKRVAATERARPSRFRAPLAIAATLATAAAILLMLNGAPPTRIPSKPPTSRPDLAEAIADARSAGYEFMLEVGKPSARLGRAILGPPRGPAPASPISLTSLETSEIVKSVGRDVASTIEPYSTSAVRALGFLLKRPGGLPSIPEGI